MSDAPVRTISGLKPRTGSPDLSRLQRRNRNTPTEHEMPTPGAQEPVIAQPSPEGEQVRDLETASAPIHEQSSTPDAATVRLAPKAESERTGRLSTYLTMDTLERARATYRATSHLEHDRTFSDFVERAIHSEIIRREAAHNAGERYTTDASRLRPGRPLGG
jgi:hypothetical protein